MHQLLTTFSEPLIYLIAFTIILLETGIIGFFFLPGDSLLFSLGLFARQGTINLWIVIGVLILSGFIGNIVGYYFGAIVREKKESLSFLRKVPQKHIKRTEHFYAKYGALTVVLSRFIPVVRTIAPFLAGVSRMKYRQYVSLSALGALLWASAVTGIGYIFGSYINLDYIVYISIGLVVAASILTPLALYLFHRYLKSH